MSFEFETVLDECLARLRQGEALEACLYDYPTLADDLRPLLETASAVQCLPIQRMAPARVAQGRERMFAAISAEFPTQAVSKNTILRYAERILKRITHKEKIGMKLVKSFVLACSLLVVLLLGAGTSAVSASALPGDLLYPVKTSFQSAQIMLTWDPAARDALKQRFQDQSRNEVRQVLLQGRAAQVHFAGVLTEASSTTWTVGGLVIYLDSATQISGTPQPGAFVEVWAATQADGTILAQQLVVDGALNHPAYPVPVANPTQAPTLMPSAQPKVMPTSLPTHEPEHMLQPTQLLVPTHMVEATHMMEPTHMAEPTHMMAPEHHSQPTAAPQATAASSHDGDHHDDGGHTGMGMGHE